MAETKEIKRFRANPIEIAILVIVTGVFCHSIYDLFNDSQSFTPAALQPMAASPISEAPRNPASLAVPAQASIELQCGQTTDEETTAEKVRISGPICGTDQDTLPSDLTQAQVLNSSNQFSATVSTDFDSARFSTDFIPLVPGRNLIQVQFTYRSGKAVTREITALRN